MSAIEVGGAAIMTGSREDDETPHHQPAQQEEKCAEKDIQLKGYLRKVKTMKKKYFVLRSQTKSGPARLEYYDNEKKFRTNCAPKRCIVLSTCFNINKKTDSKQKYTVALYTRDECFSVLAESDEEQEKWLMAMLKLHQSGSREGLPLQPAFEHVWQVSLKARGLGSSKNLTGSYRLCLTSTTLNLVKMNVENEDMVFPLSSIRRCGHSDCYFFMEVGRSAVTGAGELWMLVEDTIIAQNMHESILNAMRNMSHLDDDMRPRSRSTGASNPELTNPISVPRRPGTPGSMPSMASRLSRTRCDSMPAHSRTLGRGEEVRGDRSPGSNKPSCNSLPRNLFSGILRPRTCSEGEGQIRAKMAASSIFKLGNRFRPRTSSEGDKHFRSSHPDSPSKSRSRTIGSQQRTSPNTGRLRPHTIISRESPQQSSSFPDEHFFRHLSTVKGMSVEGNRTPEEYGSSPADQHFHRYGRVSTPDSPSRTPIREESTESGDDYMPMSPSAVSQGQAIPKVVSTEGYMEMVRNAKARPVNESYVNMSPANTPSLSELDSYMSMSPTATQNKDSPANQKEASSKVDKAKRNSDEGYMDMAPVTGAVPKTDTQAVTQTSSVEVDSYMSFTPGSGGGEPLSTALKTTPGSASTEVKPKVVYPTGTSQQTAKAAIDTYMPMSYEGQGQQKSDNKPSLGQKIPQTVGTEHEYVNINLSKKNQNAGDYAEMDMSRVQSPPMSGSTSPRPQRLHLPPDDRSYVNITLPDVKHRKSPKVSPKISPSLSPRMPKTDKKITQYQEYMNVELGTKDVPRHKVPGSQPGKAASPSQGLLPQLKSQKAEREEAVPQKSATVGSDYLNLQFPMAGAVAKPSPEPQRRALQHPASESAAAAEPKLNYIAVDLGPSEEPDENGQSRSPRSPRSPCLPLRVASDSDEKGESNYASIDFTKSEVLKNISAKVREERF
ncbi:insulin receptor substrate 1-B-like isoform X4 [Ptychodera flava]|uniref:insulin receptor substrate 1-B-like isoform X4 n=1 Tax=Ptychodera flava TaxID=63121 RepID=UPI003969C7DF